MDTVKVIITVEIPDYSYRKEIAREIEAILDEEALYPCRVIKVEKEE